MESVIVPAVDVPSSFITLRSLHRCGIRTIAVSERERPEVFCSRYCDEAVHVPDPARSATEYKDALLTLAERDDVQTVVPVREEDIYVLSRYMEEFADHIATPFPDFERLRIVQDRMQLFDEASDAGVPTPETTLLSDHTDWSRPRILKARYSILADAYREVRATAEREAIRTDGDATATGLVDPPTTKYLEPGRRPNVEELREEAGHDPIVQEFVPDTEEYSFCAMYDSGEALATFQHRQVRGFSYSGGTSAFRKSMYSPELEAEGLRLLDHLDWHGPADVEFKWDDRSGEFKLMEVNPRFWSSVPFAVEAGADFPRYYWLVATGREDRVESGYEVGIGGHLLVGELSHLLSVARETNQLVERPSTAVTLGKIVTSILRHPRFDYVDPKDLGPFVRYVSNELGPNFGNGR